MITAAALQSIWIVEWVGVVQPEWIATDENGKGGASAGLKDTAKLPVANRCLKKAIVPFQARQHPCATDDRTLRQVEIGWASPEQRIEPEGQTRWRIGELIAGNRG